MFIPNVIDPEAIKQIHDGSFPFPDLASPLFLSKRMAIKDGKLIGFIGAKLTAEGVLILNSETSAITRTKASLELWDAMKRDLKNFGLEDFHVFTKNPKFFNLLMNFKFREEQGAMSIEL
jgi:hypothetical protein